MLWKESEVPSMLELLDRRAASAPDFRFLKVVDQELCAGDLVRESNAVAGFLQSVGVQKGDRVGFLLENCAQAVVALFGILRAGAIAIPINAAYRGRFLQHVLADSGSSVVFSQHDLADRINDVLEDGQTTLRHIVVVDGTPPSEANGTLRRHAGITYWDWSDVLSTSPPAQVATVTARDTALCLYTGGTTGPSKGCILSHIALVHHAITPAEAYGRTAEDVLWTPLPLFHLNAIKFGVIGALLCGGRSVIARRFSLSGFWSAIAEESATIANLLGSMATLIGRAEQQRRDGTLRLVVAVPLPAETDYLLRTRYGVQTWSGFYGMTECSTIGLLPKGVESRPGTCGLVNSDDYEVRILDDNGREVPAGEPGEIIVRPRKPDIMFKGYWNRPQDTLKMFSDLWFHSGDIGKIDDDGYLVFVDRKGDYLRRRGENVSTSEVEAVLLEHPGIADIAVHAVPSDIAEDDIKVTAVKKADATLTEPAFFDWMQGRLPYFALPTYIEFRDELPRSPVGRVLKRELRAEGLTPSTWDREKAGAHFERR